MIYNIPYIFISVEHIYLNKKEYISSKRAAKIAGYSCDYIGQLCRAKKLDCTVVGRTWFVTEESILQHKESNKDAYKFGKNGNGNGEKHNEKNVSHPTIPLFLPHEDVKTALEIESQEKIWRYLFDDAPLFPELTKSGRYASAEIVEKLIEKSASDEASLQSLLFLPSPYVKEEKKAACRNSSLSSFFSKPFSFKITLGLQKSEIFKRPKNFSEKSAVYFLTLIFILAPLITHPFLWNLITEKMYHTTMSAKNVAYDAGQKLTSSVFNRKTELASAYNAFESLAKFFYKGVSSLWKSGTDTHLVKNSLPVELRESPELDTDKRLGMVVVPSTKDSQSDNELKNKIKDSFSDEVKVIPDEDGSSGVIRPVFKSKVDDDAYLYVLVPLKK